MIIRRWRWICVCWSKPLGRCTRWVLIPWFYYIRDILVEHKPPEPPWLGGEIRPELAHDLRVLATIEALAQALSEPLQKHMLEAVDKQFNALELPEGMEIKSAAEAPHSAK